MILVSLHFLFLKVFIELNLANDDSLQTCIKNIIDDNALYWCGFHRDYPKNLFQ